MKKILAGVLAFCLVAGAMPSNTVKFVDNSIVANAADEYTEGKFESLTYQKYSDHVVITDCDISVEIVNIPDEIEGLPVTEIGEDAFAGCAYLKEITIPNSVTSIGDGAFNICESLTEITIPDSVEKIGHGAFQSCSSLTEITIPSSVKEIGYYAFFQCSSLTDITIPDGVTLIDSFAFADCSSLTEITIPDGVTLIDSFAFADCSSLTEITIPDSVKSIGSFSFLDCSNLTEITFLNPECLFFNGIIISNRINDDDNDCYNGIIKGYEGSTAQEYAEKYGNEFVSLGKIPDSTTATYGKFGLLTYQKYSDHVVISSCDESATSVDIPEKIEGLSVTEIGDGAFSDCSTLKSLTIPESVTSIGNDAFHFCESLTEITIPDSVEKIGYEAFSNCSSLIKITIPDSVTEIEPFTFFNCSSLTNITIPNNATKIGEEAFELCSSLTEVTIPDNVTEIGRATFACCSSLTDITIPESVTSIGDDAFADCESLTNIVIPDSVTSIGLRAFSNCSNFAEITFLNLYVELNNLEIAETAVIKGYEYSTAQSYAKENGNEFVSLGEIPDSTTVPTNPEITLWGDVNLDKDINISDAVLIMQSIANPDEFNVEEQGELNGDVVDNGNGLTNVDALAIQYVEIKTITPDAFPMTSTELDTLSK